MFRSYSDHLQGARIFLIKITDLCRTHMSPAYLSKQRVRTHTICYAATSPHKLFTFLTNFKISDFNKEYTRTLKMI